MAALRAACATVVCPPKLYHLVRKHTENCHCEFARDNNITVPRRKSTRLFPKFSQDATDESSDETADESVDGAPDSYGNLTQTTID